MAKAAAKALVRNNTRRLKILRLTIFTINIIYVLISYILRINTSAKTLPPFPVSIVKPSFFIITQGILYFSLQSLARPIYSNDGAKIVDYDQDLSQSGMLEYIHDILYLTFAIQLLSLISTWFFLLYLVIPMFGLFMLLQWRKGQGNQAAFQEAIQKENAGLSRKERRQMKREQR